MTGKIFRKNGIVHILFLLPALILFTLIVYYPLLSSVRYSVTDWTMRTSEYNYVGLKNFKEIFIDSLVRAGLKNTFIFALYATFIGNSLALVLAIILDKALRLRNYFRALFYIPCLLSPIIVSAVFGDIFRYRGIFNAVLDAIGLAVFVGEWFGSVSRALPMLILVNAWQWMGYGSVIYLAGLQTISQEYYEVARIEGLGPWATFLKVTFPLLMPSVTIMTFMSLTGGLKLFDIPFVLTKGGPGYATETLGTVIYKLAFTYEKFGFAMAVAIVFFACIMVLTVIQVSITRFYEVEL